MFATPHTPDRLAHLLCAMQSRRQRRAAARELEVALDCAFAHFVLDHTTWANSLFDRHFLRGHASQTLAAYAAGELSRQQAADQLVIAWDRQFGGGDTEKRRRRRDALTPIAYRFLGRLRNELRQARAGEQQDKVTG